MPGWPRIGRRAGANTSGSNAVAVQFPLRVRCMWVLSAAICEQLGRWSQACSIRIPPPGTENRAECESESDHTRDVFLTPALTLTLSSCPDGPPSLKLRWVKQGRAIRKHPWVFSGGARFERWPIPPSLLPEVVLYKILYEFSTIPS